MPAGSSPETSWKAVEAFAIQDGDKVTVAPILPYSERSVYLDGHVVRPGKYPYSDNMSLGDVMRSYQDVLPEPADAWRDRSTASAGLSTGNYRVQFVTSVDWQRSVHLQAFDTIRVFGRYETDAPMVTVHGEVQRPGQYPLPEGLTAAQLVRMAGGFKRSALLGQPIWPAMTSRMAKKVVSHRVTINIGRAVKDQDSSADVVAKVRRRSYDPSTVGMEQYRRIRDC